MFGSGGNHSEKNTDTAGSFCAKDSLVPGKSAFFRRSVHPRLPHDLSRLGAYWLPHVSTARGPPVDLGELGQFHGDSEFEQASPDGLPMIDIHHHSQPLPHPSQRSVPAPVVGSSGWCDSDEQSLMMLDCG